MNKLSGRDGHQVKLLLIYRPAPIAYISVAQLAAIYENSFQNTRWWSVVQVPPGGLGMFTLTLERLTQWKQSEKGAERDE